MFRRLFWMGVGAAAAMWLLQRLKQLRSAAPADAARRLLTDVGAALSAGREAKRHTEADLWGRLQTETPHGNPTVIQLSPTTNGDEPFAPLRKAIKQPHDRR